MSSRRASDGGSVLSFTFLDVLMCTMGSLLLLLVVFGVIMKKGGRARRPGEESRISLTAITAPAAQVVAADAADDAAHSPEDAESLARQLEQIRSEQSKLEALRAEAAERRRDEQARISHLEDHERRLEHDLAKLHVTLQALEAAEQKQSVDQEQADADVVRLKELIRETEARLDEMRKADPASKSYAIVPYKGANGTIRRPVFVECTADAVTIQPEGIRLTVADFDGPLRSGNPLAAAVRAAHEELNGRAAAAGQADLPDPYPLFVVRPDGAAAYAAALDAIRSWDSDYGYEFVEADWKLKYSEPDPRLGQVMAHAVDEARQRQALLARVAPRQYAPRLTGAGGVGAAGQDGGGAGGSGFGALTVGGAGDRIGSHAGDGSLGGDGEGEGQGEASGNSLRNGARRRTSGGNFSDEFANAGAADRGLSTAQHAPAGQGGAPGGGSGRAVGATGSTMGGNGADSGSVASSSTANGSSDVSAGSTANGDPDAGAASAGGAAGDLAGGSAAGNAGAAGSAASTGGGAASRNGTTSSSAAGGSASGGSAASSGGNAGGMGLPPIQVGPKRRGSAADTRGANWANAEAARRASPITRPIKVIVGAERMVIASMSDATDDRHTVSFQQPVDGVLDQLVAAVHEHVADWGLAGAGMYWRPTLVVAVEPGAQRQADRLAELLENSGVDVRVPQATANAAAGGDHAKR